MPYHNRLCAHFVSRGNLVPRLDPLESQRQFPFKHTIQRFTTSPKDAQCKFNHFSLNRFTFFPFIFSIQNGIPKSEMKRTTEVCLNHSKLLLSNPQRIAHGLRIHFILISLLCLDRISFIFFLFNFRCVSKKDSFFQNAIHSPKFPSISH